MPDFSAANALGLFAALSLADGNWQRAVERTLWIGLAVMVALEWLAGMVAVMLYGGGVLEQHQLAARLLEQLLAAQRWISAPLVWLAVRRSASVRSGVRSPVRAATRTPASRLIAKRAP